MGSTAGVWFPLFLCVILYAPPSLVSKEPRFPFQCGPRDAYGTVESTVSGTQSLTVPIKESGKKKHNNNRIIGLDPEMNIFFESTWLDVQTAVQTGETVAQKSPSVSPEVFLPLSRTMFKMLSCICSFIQSQSRGM